MTKKDYVLVAKAIRRTYAWATIEQRSTIRAVVGHLVSEFQLDNPKFNKDKFIKACGLKEGK